jgi:hypothetical protein
MSAFVYLACAAPIAGNVDRFVKNDFILYLVKTGAFWVYIFFFQFEETKFNTPTETTAKRLVSIF